MSSEPLPKVGAACSPVSGKNPMALSVEPPGAATEDLMARVQMGDMFAYQEIVRQFQKKVFRVVSSYQRDPEDALEVVQDTFLKLYMARHTWQRKTSFPAWLYRIAINASIDRYRRTGGQKTESFDDVSEVQMRNSIRTPLPPGALDRLEHTERRRVLEEAVRRLPARQREIVSLRYFGEMQLEEIAGALSCPLGTVKSNLHKAIIALKQRLLERKEVFCHE